VSSLAPVRVGVAGAGPWGGNVIRACAELGVLAAVCDPDAGRLARAGDGRTAVFLTRDFDALLRAVDAVAIAAPAASHAELALRAIGAGKHVLVEKPLAMDVADAQRVADAAEHAGVRAVVGHVLLYHPAVRMLLDAVATGAIGRIVHVRARRLNLGRVRAHENVWWSFAPHDVALILALMRSSPTRVAGVAHAVRGVPVADFAYADLTFADERSAHISVSWLDPRRESRLDVFGTSGVLTFEDSRAGARLVRRPCGVSASLETWAGDEESIAFDAGAPLELEIEAFVRAARDGTATPTDARLGVEVVRVLEMVERSARAGAPDLAAAR
jgi:UDP-2-acetamido-3-amino-2,3-dideoxy-glucuronate N-acetyltransferase